LKTLAHKTGLSVLLLLVAVPIIYAFCFHIRQYTIRQRMKERMNEQVLQTISVQEEDVHWIIPGKETWLNGRLFDIRTYTSGNGLYTFTGSYDDEETALVMLLQKNQQKNDTADDEVLARLFELLQDIYKSNADDLLSVLIGSQQIFSTGSSSLSTVVISILTPPPQV